MKPVGIITDSTSDLSKEILEKYDINVLPLHIHLGEDEFTDGVDVTPADIFKWADKNNALPKTAVFSPAEAVDFLKGELEKYEEIIAFCISEEMSSSGGVMRLAAMELEAEDKIHVINSRNLSTGTGLLILSAAEMAEKGFSAEKIVGGINEIIPKVRASFVVDTLTYLHRGGRCSSVEAFAGTTLKLHPYIEVFDGKMRPGKKYRGKMKKVFAEYVRDMEEDFFKADKTRVFVTYSGNKDENVEAVIKQVEELNIFKEILVTQAGSIISSHCGPGALGVLFIAG